MSTSDAPVCPLVWCSHILPSHLFFHQSLSLSLTLSPLTLTQTHTESSWLPLTHEQNLSNLKLNSCRINSGKTNKTRKHHAAFCVKTRAMSDFTNVDPLKVGTLCCISRCLKFSFNASEIKQRLNSQVKADTASGFVREPLSTSKTCGKLRFYIKKLFDETQVSHAKQRERQCQSLARQLPMTISI